MLNVRRKPVEVKARPSGVHGGHAGSIGPVCTPAGTALPERSGAAEAVVPSAQLVSQQCARPHWQIPQGLRRYAHGTRLFVPFVPRAQSHYTRFEVWSEHADHGHYPMGTHSA